MVHWEDICLLKSRGGLGITKSKNMNIVLLTKWIWKLFKEQGLWQEKKMGQIHQWHHFRTNATEARGLSFLAGAA